MESWDGKLDQLARLFLEGHPLEDLFDFRFHLGVRRDGWQDGGGFVSARSGSCGGEGEGSGLQQVLERIHRIWVSVLSNSQR